MAWTSFDASGSGRRAEQRESKLVGEVGVLAKALQQRTRLVKHYSMPRSGFRAFFWIGSMDCAFKHQNGHGLRMCVAGAPASN
jgi:hypothetical protein